MNCKWEANSQLVNLTSRSNGSNIIILPWIIISRTIQCICCIWTGRPLVDDIFKCIFLNENVWTSLKISLKFVPKCQINNIPALIQIMAWHRPGNKPLCEPMMVWLLTHICITPPQWVKSRGPSQYKDATSYQCRNSHHRYKTVLRPSDLYDGNLHTLKKHLHI